MALWLIRSVLFRIYYMACWPIVLPILTILIYGVGIVVCLAIGLINGHLSKTPWPKVSKTGALPPESCIFALVFNWSAVLLFLVAVGYFRYVKQHGYDSRVNRWAVVVCGVGSIGFSLVGCFQTQNALVVHATAAVIACVAANVYCWMIVYVNVRYLRNKLTPNWLLITRIVVAVLETLCSAAFGIFSVTYHNTIELYTTMSSFEWTAIYLIMVFISTFIYDFRQFTDFHIYIEARNFIQTTSTPMTSGNGGVRFKNDS